MRIALIGPSYPFRGGISHYTTLLHRYLQRKHMVRLYTFSRQYPRSIYPGNAAPDKSRMQLRSENAFRIIDWLNPFSWLKSGMLIAKWSPNAVIFTWWMWGWAIPIWIITKVISFRSIAIVFVCHNVMEHESTVWKTILMKLALSSADHYIVHSRADYKNLKKMFPRAKVSVAFHPTYEIFRQDLFSKDEARSTLKIKSSVKRVILFFGIVRPYKGLRYLIEAMPRVVQELSDIYLLIVGEFWEDVEAYRRQIQDLHLCNTVEIVDKYVPNEEIERYFSAADLVILPYIGGTGSGVVQIAYGFNKPVVATKVGCLPDVVDEGKTGYLVESRDSQAIADAVVLFYRNGMASVFTQNIILQKGKFEWSRMVNAIESLLQS